MCFFRIQDGGQGNLMGAFVKKKNLLIITSAGGSGHLQTAHAQTTKALNKDGEATIIQKDILVDMVGETFGKWCLRIWHASHKRGYIRFMTLLQQNVPAADIIFGLFIFVRTLHLLLKEDITRIIDTQPVGTASMIKAIRCVNKLHGKTLILEKIITELPTEYATHFFKPIKLLSSPDRACLKLISSPPFLKKHQTTTAFWQSNCGLHESRVCYDNFPLRSAFKQYINKSRGKRMCITLSTQCLREKQQITNTISRGPVLFKARADEVTIDIKAEDKVSTLLLGSHPSQGATLKYLLAYMQMMRQSDTKTPHLFFVFCSGAITDQNSLLAKAHALIQGAPCFPSHLSVIPMSFQRDNVIAPLYHRSDATFTRSGGLTAMELASVAKGQIWVHATVKEGSIDEKRLTEKALAKGMPSWERGNAAYLCAKKGARFITPNLFPRLCAPYFVD